ncbi:hypothetical protein C8R44DRAFT_751462 [Mycena epipterygia]|nr:hypothetical protein C8R44DRAFT_751462 [Mycena epipterygia]
MHCKSLEVLAIFYPSPGDLSSVPDHAVVAVDLRFVILLVLNPFENWEVGTNVYNSKREPIKLQYCFTGQLGFVAKIAPAETQDTLVALPSYLISLSQFIYTLSWLEWIHTFISYRVSELILFNVVFIYTVPYPHYRLATSLLPAATELTSQNYQVLPTGGLVYQATLATALQSAFSLMEPVVASIESPDRLAGNGLIVTGQAPEIAEEVEQDKEQRGSQRAGSPKTGVDSTKRRRTKNYILVHGEVIRRCRFLYCNGHVQINRNMAMPITLIRLCGGGYKVSSDAGQASADSPTSDETKYTYSYLQ